MTLEEWADLPEDEDGEIVDGVLVEDEMGSFLHDGVVAWIIALLVTWGRPRGARIAASEAKYGVARGRGRKPDVSVYLKGDRRPPPRGLIRVPPSIMVEVVTPTPRDQRRDRVDKLREYAAFGVRFYWLVDPEARTFDILELLPGEGHYAHRVAASTGTVAQVPGCDALTIDLDDLWREVDQILADESADPH